MKALKGMEFMENRKKLLFHINSMGKGGAERVVSVLAGRFARDGYETIIVTLWRADEEYELAEGVRRINLGDSRNPENTGRIALALRRFTDLRKVIGKEKPDLVISFCNKANFRCSYSMLGMKIPLLVSVRNDPRIDYFPYKHGVRRMERKAAGCVFQTSDALNCFDEKFQKKSRVIWNPLDDKYLTVSDGIKERSKYIVSVGRLSAQKNQLLLLRAFRQIMTKVPEYELRIYGEESEDGVKELLCDYLHQNGMQSRVRFMGQSGSLEKEISDASLFVLSSDYEGLPNALIEAMALGIPVISTDCPCGGPGELIEDGISGCLVPVGDKDRLADAMLMLLTDFKLAEEMGQNGTKIIEKVSPDGIYRKWKEFAEELMPQKTIALYISSLRKGGAERVIANLADHLYGRGYRVILVTTHKLEDEYQVSEGICRVISEPADSELGKGRIRNFLTRFRKLRKIWKEYKPDVILSFIGKNNIMALMTSFGFHIPVAVSVRSEPDREYYSILLKILAKTLFRLASGVILQTKECLDFFPRGIRKKAVILKNPINSCFFRKRYLGEREKTIVTVGRVDENKNHQMLMKAFAGIAEEFPEYKLIIYGDGEKRKELLELAKLLGLQERILLPGNIDNVADAIYKTRVFVLSSNKEGMPNALIEAMIMGLTVVSTDCPCGGPAELIDPGENGLLIPVGDENKLMENLQFVLKNLQKADLMGERASVTSEIYSREKVLSEWENYLNSLIFLRK